MKTYKLGDIVNIFDTLRKPLSSKEREKISGIYPYYGATTIMGYVNDYIFDGQYLLIAEDGSVMNEDYTPVLQMVDGKFWVNNHAHILSAKEGFSLEYIYYCLKCKNIKPYISGSIQLKLNQEKLKKIELKLPDYEEQLRRVKILKALDDKIKMNYQNIEQLILLGETYYNRLFMEYNNDDLIYNNILNKNIPKNWNVLKLKEIESNIITGKTPSTKKEENFDGDIPFITIDDIRNNLFINKTKRTLSKIGADSQKLKYIPANSIVVSCIATVGEIGFTTKESQTNQQINSIVLKNDINKEFLYYSLKKYFSNSKAKSGNIFENMNKDEFANINILYPEIEVLQKFHSKSKFLFDKIKLLYEEIVLLNNNLKDILPEIIFKEKVDY